jgi:nucleotide-binding universal stress UspA family protein
MATSFNPDVKRSRPRTDAAAPWADEPAIRRILCPIDFSDFSRGTAAHAAALARVFDAELHALFVFPTALRAGLTAGGLDKVDPGVRSVVAQDLVHLFAPARAAGVPVEICLRSGDPVTEILDAASHGPADLIVMGTHGRSGVKRWALGTVADHVLRDAPCPVVTCAPDGEPAGQPGGSRFTGILCALDLSESSPTTLQYALLLARSMAVPLTLLHVVTTGSGAAFALPHAQRVSEARERIQQMVAGQSAVPVETVIVSGTPFREILRIAEQQNGGLVVIGNRGRHAPGRVLFGSTADQVARGADCPVLTVPPVDDRTSV